MENSSYAADPNYPSGAPGNQAGGAPGYPPYGGPGYPPTGQPVYPPMGQPGYPPQGQHGYPPPGQPGYPPSGQQGYPPPGQQGYPPPGQPGYPNTGFPSAGAPGPPVQNLMPGPPQMPGVPPGLEYLTQLDQVLCKEVVQMLEVFTDWETANNFHIVNSVGQQIFYAGEESDMLARQLCRTERGFIMHITDNFGREVIRASREFKCCSGCSWCADLCDHCAYTLKVEAPLGEVIGYVRQRFGLIKPMYDIQDSDGEPVLKIEGPVLCCTCEPCCSVEFEVQNLNDEPVGKISKKWSGLGQELFTQADNFGIKFPLDLDVKIKAIMLSSVFLINMMYFEQKQQNDD